MYWLRSWLQEKMFASEPAFVPSPELLALQRQREEIRSEMDAISARLPEDPTFEQQEPLLELMRQSMAIGEREQELRLREHRNATRTLRVLAYVFFALAFVVMIGRLVGWLNG